MNELIGILPQLETEHLDLNYLIDEIKQLILSTIEIDGVRGVFLLDSKFITFIQKYFPRKLLFINLYVGKYSILS